MKRRFAGLACGLLAFSLCAAQTHQANSHGAHAEKQLMQIEQDWANAVISKNTSALEAIVADDWMGISGGKTRDKRKLLAQIQSPDNKVESIKLVDMRVRVFGDTAVVTGGAEEKSKGAASAELSLWTDVFVKRGGKWVAVASHVSK